MFKKLLILPILGLVGLTSLSFADTVDGFTSDSDIRSITISNSSSVEDFAPVSDPGYFYMCVSSSDIPYVLTYDGYWFESVNSNVHCSSEHIHYGDNYFYFLSNMPADTSDWYDENNLKDISGKLYTSVSPITYSSSSDSSDSDGIITIPSNFVSGLNSLLTNFGNTIVNWLPTIILLGLGIVAVFSLFRVVRNYSRKSFKG